jgi:quercetin dioxygenase-like cupin family protein
MIIEPQRETILNPEAQFPGGVWLDVIATPHGPEQRATMAKVRFQPGARTAWHSHARGQTLHITSGVAWVQGRGEAKLVAYPGQTLYCPPGQEHWHGAAPDSLMEHLAMIDNADDPAASTTWLEHVTDSDYLA